jgi:tetratricopeptide (TPR) repeat protein
MKTRQLLILAVAFSFLGNVFGIESPVGTGTVPPSSISSGLVSSPNPIDTSGNLVVTGHVAGGKHFRHPPGVVPYRSSFDFGATLGSASLDSFMRRSAATGDYGRSAVGYTPYYSLSRTVTTTMPGGMGVFRPATTRIRTRGVEGISLPSLPTKKESTRQIALSSLMGSQPQEGTFDVLRPLSLSPQELERAILSEVDMSSQTKKLTTEEYQSQLEQFRHELEQVSGKAADLKQSLVEKDDFVRLPAGEEPAGDVLQQFKSRKLRTEQQVSKGEQDVSLVGEKRAELDIYEQMKLGIDDLQKTLTQLAEAEETGEAADGEGKLSGEALDVLLPGGVLGAQKGKEESLDFQQPPVEWQGMQTKSAFEAPGVISKTEMQGSSQKEQHLAAAEECLRQGRYYRAADAYTLASVYKSDDPLPHAGKSHALFAAGEYMSSALFLSRALEIFPEYSMFKVDIVSMVGDRDKLESRIADVESLLEIRDVPELNFLLGYIYHQIGRDRQAKESIDSAYEKMPKSSAVAALKKVIYKQTDSR